MIKTNIKLTQMSGEPLKIGEDDMTLGMALANILTQEKHTDPLRAYVLGTGYYKGEEVQKADLKFVEEAVKKSQIFVPIVTGQILGLLVETPTVEEKPEK